MEEHAHGLPPVQPLHQARPGERVEIVALEGDRERRQRLMDLGLVPGTRVETVRRSPLGDPILYRVRSTLVALRREDAARVQVRRLAVEVPGGPAAQAVIRSHGTPTGPVTPPEA